MINRENTGNRMVGDRKDVNLAHGAPSTLGLWRSVMELRRIDCISYLYENIPKSAQNEIISFLTVAKQKTRMACN
jgi:hypothetical protein